MWSGVIQRLFQNCYVPVDHITARRPWKPVGLAPLSLNQPKLAPYADRTRPVGNVELAQDRTYVALRCVHADAEGIRYLDVRQPFGYETKHTELAVAQRVESDLTRPACDRLPRSRGVRCELTGGLRVVQ